MAIGKELSLMIKIGGKIDKTLGSAIANAQSQLETMRNAAGKAMTAEITAVTEAGAALAVDSVKTYMNYESAIKSAAATAGVEKGTEAYKALDEAARQAGATTVKTAQESANALEYMALAGWSVEESTQALMPVLKLSAATNMDLATASDLVTDSMSAYGLGISDLTR
ncbi:MAG: phage tail tape measure protein [Oscillospiraceae bacterium]|nr:phage tail tape measure protein [Oscillospiraceae bacterium]